MSEAIRTLKLRFPEFKECYEEHRLSNLLKRYSEKNTDEEFSIEDILSLSSKKGIVDRRELLKDTYSKVNHLSYIKTRLNDFVYGKSISASYPYGLFKANNCRDGLLSTLYFTFKTFDNVSPIYLDKYFSHYNRANNFLKKYVLVGDRYITADSDYILSGKIFIPTKPEQQKIATFLTSVDTKIEKLSKKQELLSEYKKGLMQKIFSQEIRFKADDGSKYPDWEENKLKDSFEVIKPIKVEDGLSPYLEIGDINSSNHIYILKDKKTASGAVAVEKDTLLISTVRPGLNKIIITRENVYASSAFATIKLKNSFLFHLLTTKLFNNLLVRLSEGGTYPTINKQYIYNLSINLPGEEEQTKIANFLSSIDSKIEQLVKQLDESKQFKKALLQQMFV